MRQDNPNEKKLHISPRQLKKIKNHLRENNITISEFNTWMKEEMNISLRDRIIMREMVENDLDGFMKEDSEKEESK
jgi:hypothetical protein